MEQVLLVVHVFIALALIGIVLMQRSDSDGFGLGSGSGMNLLSGRSSANLLTRTTAILATLFIANSLLLSIIASNKTASSIVDQIPAQIEEQAPAASDAADDESKKEGSASDADTTPVAPAEATSDEKPQTKEPAPLEVPVAN